MSTGRVDIEIAAKTSLGQASAEVSKLGDQLNKLDGAQGKTATSGRNMAQAMLQGSRGIQDFAAAGLPGIANNLESIAMALGAGAGVAGAATVAAVAVQALGPHLVDLINALIPLDDVLGKTSAKLEQDAVEAGQAYMEAVDSAGKQTRAFEQSLKSEAEAVDQGNAALDRRVKLLEAKQKIELLMEDAALAARVQDIQASGLSPAEQARQIAQARIDSQGRKGAIEEQGRQQAMQAAVQQRDTLLAATTQATARRQGAEQRTQDAGLFQLNQAEIAKLENDIRERGMAGELSPQEIADRDARDKAARDEIARRTASNAGITSRYGGQAPTEATAEQLAALRASEQGYAGQLSAAEQARLNLSVQQQAAREEAAARQALATQAIARDYTSAAMPGTPMFNAPGAALDYMQRTGRAAALPGLPGAAAPQGGGYRGDSPLAGGLNIDSLMGPVNQATQAIQGNPLDLSELGRPLESLASGVVEMKTQLQQQIKDLGAKVQQTQEQIKNAR